MTTLGRIQQRILSTLLKNLVGRCCPIRRTAQTLHRAIMPFSFTSKREKFESDKELKNSTDQVFKNLETKFFKESIEKLIIRCIKDLN